ncbi:uncharacterized protein [Scyliorhinus torazame]|uniref:uncharacterized protein n=1 Tax=Scyliorhinus torazame TaxID=75743 RepID=UPI003B5AD684
MSGYGPYFADDEESSEDKISHFGSANTGGNEGIKSSENPDESKSNATSAFSSSFHTNEDAASFATLSDQADHHSERHGPDNRLKVQGAEMASKAGTESSAASCEDLVIVLEESKFLKVLEDVVKELVEKLVTEKISSRGSAGSRGQSSAARSKGSNGVDIKRSFEKKVKCHSDSRRVTLDPDLPKRLQRSNLDDENLTSPSRSSKTPSESAQGKAAQPKPKANKDNGSGVKAASASKAKKGGAEPNVPPEPKKIIHQVCYFKSKSSAARKNSRREKGPFHKDDTCKIICRTYMRPHPDDVKEQNMKIANSLFAATFSLFMRKIRKQESLSEKIGIALCGPRQCFEECSSEDKMEIVQFESPEPTAQSRRSTARSGSVFPKLCSDHSSKWSSGSQQSSVCFKHCADASTNVRSRARFTVLPKL